MKQKEIAIVLIRFCVLSLIMMSMTGCWYIEQAWGYFHDRLSAIPLDEYLKQNSTDGELQTLSVIMDRVRRFAVEKFNLTLTKNYTKIVPAAKEYVATVVSACKEDSFTRYYWNYPLVGAMPYRGFYNKDKAKQEADRLKAQGYDVFIRNVEAFSSLGYFSDPLYTFMKHYSEDEIAELIFHESAHATLFIKGASQFNEEFATFIGQTATQIYLETLYGKNSSLIQKRMEQEHDHKLFIQFLQETARQLEIIYNNTTLTKAEKIAAKQKIIAERAIEYETAFAQEFVNPNYKKFNMQNINNAYIDLYRLYESDLSLYEQWFTKKSNSDIATFIADMKKLAKLYQSNIKEAMKKELQ
ncbi:MAG TPA: aminopeptidase [Spirochaetia bacterium]|nr:aminopeptidase [Spirochaetia bacterium]